MNWYDYIFMGMLTGWLLYRDWDMYKLTKRVKDLEEK